MGNLLALLLILQGPVVQEPVDHAKRIVELLRQEKFNEVRSEFNAQMTNQLSKDELAGLWSGLRREYGNFKSILDTRLRSLNSDPAVALRIQFDHAVVGLVLVFDHEDKKIVGLQFLPDNPR